MGLCLTLQHFLHRSTLCFDTCSGAKGVIVTTTISLGNLIFSMFLYLGIFDINKSFGKPANTRGLYAFRFCYWQETSYSNYNYVSNYFNYLLFASTLSFYLSFSYFPILVTSKQGVPILSLKSKQCLQNCVQWLVPKKKLQLTGLLARSTELRISK